MRFGQVFWGKWKFCELLVNFMHSIYCKIKLSRPADDMGERSDLKSMGAKCCYRLRNQGALEDHLYVEEVVRGLRTGYLHKYAHSYGTEDEDAEPTMLTRVNQ